MFYERHFQQLEEDAARQRAAERLAELARESPPERPVCAFRSGSESQCRPGVEAQFGPLSETLPGTKEKQDKRRGRKRPRQKHLCPQCGQLRGLCGDWKWGQNPGRDIISEVTIPESLLPQGKKQRSTPERSQYEQKERNSPLYLSPEKRPSWSAGIRRTGAGASPPSLSGRWSRT